MYNNVNFVIIIRKTNMHIKKKKINLQQYCNNEKQNKMKLHKYVAHQRVIYIIRSLNILIRVAPLYTSFKLIYKI